jgi:hypothetical protein
VINLEGKVFILSSASVLDFLSPEAHSLDDLSSEITHISCSKVGNNLLILDVSCGVAKSFAFRLGFS